MPRNSSAVPEVLPWTAPPEVLTTGAAVVPWCVEAVAAVAAAVAARVPRAMAVAQNRAPARQPIPVFSIWIPIAVVALASVNAAALTITPRRRKPHRCSALAAPWGVPWSAGGAVPLPS
jgi:hypothetical protein